jgi:hypothetical protein
MFTHRFIPIPIKTFSQSHKDLTGQDLCDDKTMKINPMEIVNYYPTVDMEMNCVKIEFKNGNGILCYMSMKEFERILNEYGTVE